MEEHIRKFTDKILRAEYNKPMEDKIKKGVEDFNNRFTDVMKDLKEEESHYCCWEQDTPACGIPIEKHTQCCLCEKKTKRINYIKSWYWLIIGKCMFCGGKLDKPWDDRKQFCLDCGNNN